MTCRDLFLVRFAQEMESLRQAQEVRKEGSLKRHEGSGREQEAAGDRIPQIPLKDH